MLSSLEKLSAEDKETLKGGHAALKVLIKALEREKENYTQKLITENSDNMLQIKALQVKIRLIGEISKTLESFTLKI